MSYDPLDLGKGARYASDEWSVADSSFEPLEALRLPNPQTLDRGGLVAYYASMGWLADLPDTSGSLCSTRCGRSSPPMSTVGYGKRTSTGHAALSDDSGVPRSSTWLYI